MIIALSGFIRTDAGGRKTLALARAVNHVLSAHGFPVSRFAFGQTTSREAIHEAVNEALARRRMIVTPTDPENAWRIGYDFFERLAQEVVDATRSMGFTVAIREAEEALIARGYRPSAPPPMYTEPALPVPTVIVTPTLTEPATIRTIVIQPAEGPSERWEAVTTYAAPTEALRLPPVYTPVVAEEVGQEAGAMDSSTVFMIVGGVIGGLALASMIKRGRQ